MCYNKESEEGVVMSISDIQTISHTLFLPTTFNINSILFYATIKETK
jgi:hypothetical protein